MSSCKRRTLLTEFVSFRATPPPARCQSGHAGQCVRNDNTDIFSHASGMIQREKSGPPRSVAQLQAWQLLLGKYRSGKGAVGVISVHPVVPIGDDRRTA